MEIYLPERASGTDRTPDGKLEEFTVDPAHNQATN